MKNKIYFLSFFICCISIFSISAQEKPKSNCGSLPEGSVSPEDGSWCDLNGSYAQCMCAHEKAVEEWRIQFDKNNALAKEDKNHLIQLQQRIINNTKKINDLNLNEGHENFVQNKREAIRIYQQAISQFSSLSVNYVNDENRNLKLNRTSLERDKTRHLMTLNHLYKFCFIRF